jgi:glutamyl-tRNA synthetase
MPEMKTRTRFAPSPTGFLHIGGLRTALYAYALAKHNRGDFILRIEDTDQKREVEGATKALQETLKKFNLNWDEFYLQSERVKQGIYQKPAEKLISAGHAFFCQCPPKNAETEGFSLVLRDPCRDKNFNSGAIKLKVPDNQTISYYDFVHQKEISWKSDTVYDATLLKSDGFPTYHLAAMVDDLDMKITHILRGHDWLPSTPIHLLVFKYLGGSTPQIGHLTDILSATTGKKLSKRTDSVYCEQFLADGFLPEALLNFIMLLGWAPKDNRELFTLEEFVKHFDPRGFQDANPRFLDQKLLWFNGQYLRQKSDQELLSLVRPEYPESVSNDLLLQIIPLAKARISTLPQFKTLTQFFFETPNYSDFTPDQIENIKVANEVLSSVDWNKEAIESQLIENVKKNNWKNSDFFMALRLAVTGQKVTPPLTESMLILGKDEVVRRLSAIIKSS